MVTFIVNVSSSKSKEAKIKKISIDWLKICRPYIVSLELHTKYFALILFCNRHRGLSNFWQKNDDNDLTFVHKMFVLYLCERYRSDVSAL